MNFLLNIFLFSFLGAQNFVYSDFEPGRRDKEYRIWVYFDKKDESIFTELDPAAIKRRVKHNIFTATKYDSNIKEEYIKELEAVGAEIKNQSRWLNAVSLVVDINQIELIQKLPFVKKIEPVRQHKKKKATQSVDDQALVNRDIDYGLSSNQIEQINCRIPHIAGYFGQGVRVLYIDTGFELNHEAYDSLNLIGQYDFINNDQNAANETDQEILENQDDHGTLCLSVMAGYALGSLIGPAFKSEYLLAKTEIMAEEIQQEEDNYIAALEWGESLGADIACASLGYLDWYSYEDLDGNTAATTKAIDIASELGVLCVNSAGNEGNNPWYHIITPADADSVLSVGAVDANDVIANFSSRGPTFDGRIKPEVCARGVSTYCVRSNTENIYRNASGTSFSAPLAAGAAAVIMSANPEWTNMQVREAIMMTASQFNSPDNDYGHGILNTWAAINYQFTASVKSETFLPNAIYVNNAYPNPFNPEISIKIDGLSNNQHVTVGIYDIHGKLVKYLHNQKARHNMLELSWNAERLSSGIYLLRTDWGYGNDLQKITLLK
ncbi:MAG: S8 family serine peptidase [Candidatus Marinimicrobia bacterium]|nr:S8 family serine peptidase [Candidatus Neomarinimicrobiota bacterium]